MELRLPQELSDAAVWQLSHGTKIAPEIIDIYDDICPVHIDVKELQMNRFAIVSVAIVAPILVGCGDGSVNGLYREGLTYDQLDRATTSCEVAAAQQVPASIRTTTTPTYTTPVQTYCNTVGGFTNCYNTGGQTYGGDTVSTDANEALRTKVRNQCYAQQGIGLYNFKPCTPEQAASFKSSSVLPKLNSNTCFVSLPGNRIAYHTPPS